MHQSMKNNFSGSANQKATKKKIMSQSSNQQSMASKTKSFDKNAISQGSSA